MEFLVIAGVGAVCGYLLGLYTGSFDEGMGKVWLTITTFYAVVTCVWLGSVVGEATDNALNVLCTHPHTDECSATLVTALGSWAILTVAFAVPGMIGLALGAQKKQQDDARAQVALRASYAEGQGFSDSPTPQPGQSSSPAPKPAGGDSQISIDPFKDRPGRSEPPQT